MRALSCTGSCLPGYYQDSSHCCIKCPSSAPFSPQAAVGVASCRPPANRASSLGSWQLLESNISIPAVHVSLISPTKVLLINRGSDALPPNNTWWSTKYGLEYDFVSKARRVVKMVKGQSGCASGSNLGNGTLVLTGWPTKGTEWLRTFSTQPAAQFNDLAFQMTTVRWYATMLTLGNGDIWIVGGAIQPELGATYANPTTEFFPSRGAPRPLQILKDALPFHLYPHLGLLPDGNAFVFVNRKLQIINPNTGDIVKQLPDCPGGSRTYPMSGVVTMLPLSYRNDYTVEILACGGSSITTDAPMRLAQAQCSRIKPYDASPVWVSDDDMPFPRVLGQSMHLPDGKILILNGAEIGKAGHTQVYDGSYTGLKADSPIFNPVLYNPTSDPGSRWTVLAPTTIPRMYHSSAILVPDGRVLVLGSSSNLLICFDPLRCKYPTELRVEAFSPPYLTGAIRPLVSDVATTVTYGQLSKLTLRNVPNLTNVRARLMVMPFATHGMAMSERSVEVSLTLTEAQPDGTLIINWQMPSNINLAPKGAHHYLFVVSAQGVPSVGTRIIVQ